MQNFDFLKKSAFIANFKGNMKFLNLVKSTLDAKKLNSLKRPIF